MDGMSQQCGGVTTGSNAQPSTLTAKYDCMSDSRKASTG